MAIETKPKCKLSKDAVNVIRTVMRNNIELTNIADNKANVLLSLNALLIAFIVPIVISNLGVVKQYYLGIPITLLILTSSVTIFLSVMVLIPRGFGDSKQEAKERKGRSPFFFGNFYHMNNVEFQNYFCEVLNKKEDLHNHLIEDLYFLGYVLGQKMSQIRWAFRIFLIGFFSAVGLTTIFILVFG